MDLNSTSPHVESTPHDQPHAPDPATIRDAYADLLIANRHDPLIAGTPEWSALENGDPRKTAAVIRAAVDWAQFVARDTLIEYQAGLADYLDGLAEVDAALDRLVDKRAALAVSAAGKTWGSRPSHDELQRRRAIPGDAARPIPSADVLAEWVATGQTTSTAPAAAQSTRAPRDTAAA